ncbi:hypothetical protein ACFLX5_02315 [Chloroflexota bacterium]
MPLLAFGILVWTGAGCAGSTGEIEAGLGREFTLSIGKTAVILGEGLSIRFDEVIEDSRCPKDVVCIWEGRVSCVVQVIEGDSTHEMVLTEQGMSDGYATETYGEYRIDFHVEPYPEEADDISQEEYRLLLTVSK